MTTTPQAAQVLTDEEIADIARDEELLLFCDGLCALTDITRIMERAILAKLQAATPASTGEPPAWAMLCAGKLRALYFQKPSLEGYHSDFSVRPLVYGDATPAEPAQAWAEGYRAGVADERTSEANICIAGFGMKVEPARENPYGITRPTEPAQADHFPDAAKMVALTDEQVDHVWKKHVLPGFSDHQKFYSPYVFAAQVVTEFCRINGLEVKT